MKPQNLVRLLGASLVVALVFALSPAASAQSASTFVTSGIEKYRQGDFDGAIADFTKALELNSSYLGAYNNRGLARTNQGNFDGAITDFSDAIKLKPTFTEAYYNRGNAEFLQGNLEGAIADYTKTIGLKADHQGAYFHLGLARDAQMNYDGAALEYGKAFNAKPANDESANYLVLYNALLTRRLGLPKDEHLKAASGWDNAWSRALASFLSDQMSETALMSLADTAEDHDEKIREQTEALYFSGVVKAIAGDKSGARANLTKARDQSGPAAFVHRLAQMELDHR